MNLANANLADADLSFADLSGANLADAHLWNTDLSHADLTGKEPQLTAEKLAYTYIDSTTKLSPALADDPDIQALIAEVEEPGYP